MWLSPIVNDMVYALPRFGKLTVCAKAEGKVKPIMPEALLPLIEYTKYDR